MLKEHQYESHYNANEVVTELFESLLARYQIGLEISMRGSDFILKSGGREVSKIVSPDWIKNKRDR